MDFAHPQQEDRRNKSILSRKCTGGLVKVVLGDGTHGKFELPTCLVDSPATR